jgi:Ca-activated chloride channel family protein
MFHPVRSTSCPAVLLFLIAFTAGASAQTSIDDVHIAPRAVEVATASAPRLSDGSLIRTSTDLVMVPVTITDELNRPVIGLGQGNFQLFENKKPQQIKNFSSEDSPISIGIIIDTSGSMTNKMERVRDAVVQF